MEERSVNMAPLVPANSNGPLSTAPQTNGRKRKRGEALSTPISVLVERVKFLSQSSDRTPFAQLNYSEELRRLGHEILEQAEKIKEENHKKIKTEIEEKWTLDKSIQDWEKEIARDNKRVALWEPTIVGEKTSQQFNYIVKHLDRSQYNPQLKNVYGIFLRVQQGDAALPPNFPNQKFEIEHGVMERISEGAKLFEEEDKSVYTKFQVEGELFSIPTTCILKCESPVFKMLLLDGIFSESSNQAPIQLSNIDLKNFLVLKSWLEAPSLAHFSKMSVVEILKFILVIHQYELPKLIEACDEALARIVTNDNFIELLKIVDGYRADFRSRNIRLSSFLRQVYNNLNDIGMNVKESMISETWVGTVSTTRYPDPYIKIENKFLKNLKIVQEISFFKDAANIHLDLSKLTSLKKDEKKNLKDCFSNVQTVSLCIRDTKTKSAIKWDFLTSFKNLTKVNISFAAQLPGRRYLEAFKKHFPQEHPWEITFDLWKTQVVENYTAQQGQPNKGNRKDPFAKELSVDDFIQLKLLERKTKTSILTYKPDDKFGEFGFFKSPHSDIGVEVASLPYLTEAHLEALFQANKIDLDSKVLNLSYLTKISPEFTKKMIDKFEKVEEFILIDAKSPHSDLGEHVKKVTKLIVSWSRGEPPIFSRRGFLENFFQKDQKKELTIILEKILPPIEFIKFLFKRSDLVRTAICFTGNVSLIIHEKTFIFKIVNINDPHNFLPDPTLFRFLANVAQEFSQKKTVLNLEAFLLWLPKYQGMMDLLSQSFPQIKELGLNNPDMTSLTLMKAFNDLELCTFRELREKSLLGLEDADMKGINSLGINIASRDLIGLPLHHFLEKSKNYLKLYPNLDALCMLNEENRNQITDYELLELKPKSAKIVDFSDMAKITHKGVLEFLKDLSVREIDLKGCDRLLEELKAGVVALPHFLRLCSLWKELGRSFLSNKESWYSVYRSQMKDEDLRPNQGSIADVITSETLVDLSNMPMISREGFSNLLQKREVKNIRIDSKELVGPILRLANRLNVIEVPLNFLLEEFSSELFKSFSKKNGEKNSLITFLFKISEINLFKEFPPEFLTFPPSSRKIVFRSDELFFISGKQNFECIIFSDLEKCTSKDTLHSLEVLKELFKEKSIVLDLRSLVNFTSSRASILFEGITRNFSHASTLCLNSGLLLPDYGLIEFLKSFNHLNTILLPTINFDSVDQSIIAAIRSSAKFIRVDSKAHTIQNFIKESKHAFTLFPNYDPWQSCLKTLRSDITDEHLLSLKPPEGCFISGSFVGFTKISLDGLREYLKGLKFSKLNLSECTQFTENDIKTIQDEYNDIDITTH